ncbi:MAG TPA: acetylglutamate kinase [Candidatus Hydrogenedentes bacterium]|jgi:acetylglutamate kinase|nr:acetylglutamate kinase [Candidatus Hydrogenedentota bacterium]HOM47761.1 acetylglutamate kinase [Candidatus Hydrogenedentota bacterium]HOR51071.1 acetylglutamate kinase [Candidatus Hydrogenedentota bacterium]HPX86520.1 acetylglutamate kinase [Candidatus Hydrogenedentota bacterium]HQB03628.1 acetylglutamate kinase [Candidatus Hydrogenedentota bacterium]
MQELIKKAEVLIEALPYIRQFFGKTVLIKYGGAAMLDPALRASTIQDVVLMRYVGMNPIIVHGGGPAINGMLKRLDIQSHFTAQGLRVTDSATMEVVEMMLAGSVNKDIVNLINCAGGEAVGLCGKDGRMLYARKKLAESGEDLGQVGEITSVNTRVLTALCESGMIPVVAPIATDEDGGTWNINADTAAGDIAAAVKAEKLVFLTDTPGLLREVKNPETLIKQVHISEVQRLKEQGIIAGGMVPKVEACIKALNHGVRRTHIVDGRVPHSMLLEIFTDKGMGSLVTRDTAVVQEGN